MDSSDQILEARAGHGSSTDIAALPDIAPLSPFFGTESTGSFKSFGSGSQRADRSEGRAEGSTGGGRDVSADLVRHLGRGLDRESTPRSGGDPSATPSDLSDRARRLFAPGHGIDPELDALDALEPSAFLEPPPEEAARQWQIRRRTMERFTMDLSAGEFGSGPDPGRESPFGGSFGSGPDPGQGSGSESYDASFVDSLEAARAEFERREAVQLDLGETLRRMDLGVFPGGAASDAGPQGEGAAADDGAGSHGWGQSGPALGRDSARDGSLGREKPRVPPPQRRVVTAVVGDRGSGKSTVIREALSRFKTLRSTPFLNTGITLWSATLELRSATVDLEVYEIETSGLKFDAKTGITLPDSISDVDTYMICYDATSKSAFSSLTRLLQGFWTHGTNLIPVLVFACKSDPIQGRNAVPPYKVVEICNVYRAGLVAFDGGKNDANNRMKSTFLWVIDCLVDGQAALERDATAELRTATSPTANSSAGARSAAMVAGGSLASSAYYSMGDRSQGLASSHEIEFITTTRKKQASDLYSSREAMIDKFLFSAVTGKDEQYVSIFLIIFRRFTRPYKVLATLTERFDYVASKLDDDPLLGRFAQIKLCSVLSMWFQQYPHDFAAPETLALLRSFLNGFLLKRATWVVHYAIDMLPQLDDIENMPDVDSAWGLPDGVGLGDERLSGDGGSGTNGASEATIAASEREARDMRESREPRRPSDATTSSSVASHGVSRVSTPLSDASFEGRGCGESRHSHGSIDRVLSDPRLSDTRFLPGVPAPVSTHEPAPSRAALVDASNLLLMLPDADIAALITRLTFAPFAEMVPRDLIRHVLAPRDPRNPLAILRDSASPVVRSINFVNRLSEWTANLILVQSRLKTRARVYAKLIQVAGSLRKEDNFDALMGVLAGLNSQPVFRLTETKALIDASTETANVQLAKRLQSLNRLMSSNRSFAAYRIAIENSGTSMLPYLGVHLQEITVINEVKNDMTNGLVNWSKFFQMGRSAAIVSSCPKTMPTTFVHRELEDTLLRMPLFDSDTLYTFSYQYQPRSSKTQTDSAPERKAGKTRFRKFVSRVGESFGT